MILNTNEFDGYAGATYAREVKLSMRNAAWGSNLIGVEFGIRNPQNAAEVYAVASTANGKVVWTAAGTFVISIPQHETALWTWERGGWYLDLIQPNLGLDADGYRTTILRGNLLIAPRAPSAIVPGFPTNSI